MAAHVVGSTRRRCGRHQVAFLGLSGKLLLVLGLLIVSVVLGNEDDYNLLSRQQIWDRFVEQLSAVSPEQELLLRERAQALGNEYFSKHRVDDEDFLTDDAIHRALQGPLVGLNLTGPTRQCGEVIAELSLADLHTIGNAFINVILPPSSPLGSYATVASLFLGMTLTYAIQVQTICSSCEDVVDMYAGESFLTDTSDYGFGTYCGADRYGYNVTTSGLLMLPIDNSTGEVFTQAVLRGSIFTHGTTAGSQRGPSGLFPTNATAAVTQQNSTLDLYEVGALLDIIPAIIGASAGAVAILPDNIGYGQSYDYQKGYLIYSLYQQASVTMFLAARRMLLSVTSSDSPCTVLDTVVTVTGYSEGGYSAFSSCLAFNQLSIEGTKVRVLNCQCGGTPFDLDYVISYTFGKETLCVSLHCTKTQTSSSCFAGLKRNFRAIAESFQSSRCTRHRGLFRQRLFVYRPRSAQ
jgi:hypothetical protein